MRANLQGTMGSTNVGTQLVPPETTATHTPPPVTPTKSSSHSVSNVKGLDSSPPPSQEQLLCTLLALLGKDMKAVAKGRTLPGRVMHNHKLGMDVLRVSLVRVLPSYERLTLPSNIYEEDDDPRALEDCTTGFLKWPTGDIIFDKYSPNRTPSPNNVGLAVPPG